MPEAEEFDTAHIDQLAARARDDLGVHIDAAAKTLSQGPDETMAIAVIASALIEAEEAMARDRLASILAVALVRLAKDRTPPLLPVRVDPKIRAHVVRSGFTIGADHPLANVDCPVCDEPLARGPVSLVYVGRFPDDVHGWTAASVAVHDACTDSETPPRVIGPDE